MVRSASIEASKPTPNAELCGTETEDRAGLGSEDGVKDGANNGAKEGSVVREVSESASVPLD